MKSTLIILTVIQIVILLLIAPFSYGQSGGLLKIVVGGGLCDGAEAKRAALYAPHLLHVVSSSKMFICDQNNRRIRQVVNGTISTVAGNGSFGFDDRIDAKLARLGSVFGVVVNSLGEIIFTEQYTHRIRKVLTNGTLITIAGTGVGGYNGDGIPAVNAQVKVPRGIAVDASDSIYFCDTDNSRIRKIDTNGTITTIATASSSYGIAVHTSGEVYFSEYFGHRVRKIKTDGQVVTVAGTGASGYSGDGGPATSAQISNPSGVAVNSNGELFFGEIYSHVVRKVFTNGTITTILGDGNAGDGIGDGVLAVATSIRYPKGVSISPDNNEVYVSDENNKVYRIATDGKLYHFAGEGEYGEKYCLGNGDPLNVAIQTPSGFAIRSDGAYYFTDLYNSRISKIENGTISEFAGNGLSGFNGDGIDAKIAKFRGTSNPVLLPNGDLIFSDGGNNRIRKIFSNGTIVTIAGTGNYGYNGDGILAINADLSEPYGVAINQLGEVFITQPNACLIRKILSNGTIVTIAGTGNYGYNGDGILAINAELSYPHGIAVNSIGEVIFSERYGDRIRKILTNGTIITIAGTGVNGYNGDYIDATTANLNNPSGIALSQIGELYIAEYSGYRVRKILNNGTIITVAGSGAVGYNGNNLNPLDTMLTFPMEVAVNSKGEVLIADSHIRLLSFYCNNTLASDSNVCSGNGICVGPDQCFCNDGWIGLNCSIPICYNIPANNSDVCSGNGNCVGPDQCICNDGWIGSNCSIPICYNIAANNSNVCSGNGNCVNRDNCICNSGWTGLNCSFPICHNVNINDPNVCSGNGICVYPNQCICNDGWIGLNCSIPICYNIPANNSNACSGNGNCVGLDQCICNNGWIGSMCSIPTCYNISANNSNVCNGNGNCTNLDTCTCSNGWIGLNCSISNTTNTINNTMNINNTNTINNTININNTNTINNTINSNNTININNTNTINNTAIMNNSTNINNQTNLNNTLSNNSTNNNSSILTQFNCFGVSNMDSNVCSGRGQCYQQNICQCYQDAINGYWAGNNCTLCKPPYFGSDCKSDSTYFFALFSIPIVGTVTILSALIVKGLLKLRFWKPIHPETLSNNIE